MSDAAPWDYVIIGAGSAGSVLAERLSRNPAHRVLLIEAGGENRSLLVDMPKGIARLVNSPEHTWVYQMADLRYPESPAPEVWIRGRGLGGSSAINGMIWSRGEPQDYDDWAAMGCTGWNAASMTAAYRSLEDHALGGSDLRGSGGPVRITPGSIRYPLTDAIIAAGKAMGLAETEDLNSKAGDRIGYYSHNIRNGFREGGGRAFIAKARKRKNFHHMLHTLARRVVIEDGRVTGVELQRQGRAPWVEPVGGEVIVCCGTLESPLLLERSGIGDGAVLQAAGIAPLVESPDVGCRMREHLSFALPHRMTRPAGISQRYHGIGLAKSVLRYVFTRSGVMAEGPWEVGAFCHVAHPQGRTDLQLYLGGYAFALSDDNHPVPLGKVDRKPGISVYGQLLLLTSEGSVHVTSADPETKPTIHPNWLDTDYDRQAAIASVRYMRRFMARPELSDVMGEELLPGTHIQSDEAILDSFRRLSTSGLHGTGTCRMGGDASSVVDPQLRVRGVTGLRVADCSVMPALVSGNTNAPAMAVGWRAADIIPFPLMRRHDMAYDIDDMLAHFTLEQTVLRYCTAIDRLDDLDFMMENFTEDAVLDLTGLLLPRFEGHDQIRGFYAQVFEDVSHHMHVLSNFRVVKLAGDAAQIHCYIAGMGRSKAGIDMQVYVYYDLDLRKVDGTWKISRFYEAPQLPMPDSVTQVHKKN